MLLSSPLSVFNYTSVAIVIALTCLIYFTRLSTHPLRKVPGPFLGRFTRLWELHKVLQGRFESTNLDLHRKYGPIVRLAPNRYSINDPTCVRPIYGIGSKFYKSSYYHPFGNPDKAHKDTFSERSNEQHAANKRKQANMYSMTSLKQYEPFVDSVNATFLNKLTQFAETGKSFDLFDWMQFYAFDVIGEITIGRTFGMLEAGRDRDGILDAIDFANGKHGARIGHLPELHTPMIWLAKTFGLRNPLKSVTDAVDEEIALRKSGENTVTDREDFLGKSMKLQDHEKLDRFDLFNVVAQNIGAGSDTTGISATAIIYYLLKNPHCTAKLRRELDEATAAGDLSETVTFQEGQKLQYLQAVIKEALRLHPAVGMPLARVVPEGGATLAGQFFPEGSVVGINAWVLHRDPRIWGNDAEQFNPDRWLGPSEKIAALESNFFAFGYGARTCLGKNISLLELTKLLPQLLRRIEFVPAQEGEWATETAWFVKQKYEVRVQLREGTA